MFINEPLQVLFLTHSKGDAPFSVVVFPHYWWDKAVIFLAAVMAYKTTTTAIHFKCHLPPSSRPQLMTSPDSWYFPVQVAFSLFSILSYIWISFSSQLVTGRLQNPSEEADFGNAPPSCTRRSSWSVTVRMFSSHVLPVRCRSPSDRRRCLGGSVQTVWPCRRQVPAVEADAEVEVPQFRQHNLLQPPSYWLHLVCCRKEFVCVCVFMCSSVLHVSVNSNSQRSVLVGFHTSGVSWHTRWNIA